MFRSLRDAPALSTVKLMWYEVSRKGYLKHSNRSKFRNGNRRWDFYRFIALKNFTKFCYHHTCNLITRLAFNLDILSCTTKNLLMLDNGIPIWILFMKLGTNHSIANNFLHDDSLIELRRLQSWYFYFIILIFYWQEIAF